MLYPSIDKLLDKVDSKYSLVVAAAKRARQLREGTKSEITEPKSHKMVGVALEELYLDNIHYEKIQSPNQEGLK
ncbi:DNA-directed RNA polymerase subunit omega [Paenibacillus aurantius]|uniref:DNA-directed RNA polymerase subunit omega n=1 Tax=Paenibacillus aurantius TaxID=2918900 RepID=A0AA96LKD9_9BACL|nr:DNA-directed RNA polymerase subunit omega [Paenibacillus aurantius]WJH33217.1 DNA-directed RNA polymerase subunit omega [Paenibacillus sp. CC-CFT747]WNQ13666.1 DNA-directed RNA polymerase subunit omega [Paenibacillus aurantius]